MKNLVNKVFFFRFEKLGNMEAEVIQVLNQGE